LRDGWRYIVASHLYMHRHVTGRLLHLRIKQNRMSRIKESTKLSPNKAAGILLHETSSRLRLAKLGWQLQEVFYKYYGNVQYIHIIYVL
jgi:hypothetical protein